MLRLLAGLMMLASLRPVAGPVLSGPQEKKGTDKTAAAEQQSDTVRVTTSLVIVPVMASDYNDVYLPDLKKEEFTIQEDGLPQEIAFFSEVKAPFHVVLMLDTSGSTQEKIQDIQRAAVAFVQQLQAQDRVRVISFDDEVRDLSDFTSDRAALRQAIEKTRPGKGTKLYDACRLALSYLKRIEGRKAIVLFTDGVDWRSDEARADENIRMVEESGVIVYPIRYDTRRETEELVRRQQQAGESVDLGSILGGPSIGRTPPTMPGGSPTPGSGGSTRNDPYKLPGPPIIIEQPYPRRYPDPSRYPDPNRYPDPTRYPGGTPVPGRFPDPRTGRYPDDSSRWPDDRGRVPDASEPPARPRREDSISVLLDSLYRTADTYLQDLAIRSGGKLQRADTLGALPEALARIAAELRTQYSLGFYSTNTARDGSFRKLKVQCRRQGVVIRARPGYRTSKE